MKMLKDDAKTMHSELAIAQTAICRAMSASIVLTQSETSELASALETVIRIKDIFENSIFSCITK